MPSISSCVDKPEFPILHRSLVSGVVADGHPLHTALKREDEHTTVKRVLGVRLRQLGGYLELELRIGEQRPVLGVTALDPGADVENGL